MNGTILLQLSKDDLMDMVEIVVQRVVKESMEQVESDKTPLSLLEAARLMGVGKRTVTNYEAAGHFTRCTPLGVKPKYLKSEILKWMKVKER